MSCDVDTSVGTYHQAIGIPGHGGMSRIIITLSYSVVIVPFSFGAVVAVAAGSVFSESLSGVSPLLGAGDLNARIVSCQREIQ